MPFAEDPAHLSKSRLKSDLVAHNVALPSAASKKAVYVELHLKHIDQKNAADFSSDEEDRADVSSYLVASWFSVIDFFKVETNLMRDSGKVFALCNGSLVSAVPIDVHTLNWYQ